MAQRKRAGLITRRALDRNQLVLFGIFYISRILQSIFFLRSYEGNFGFLIPCKQCNAMQWQISISMGSFFIFWRGGGFIVFGFFGFFSFLFFPVDCMEFSAIYYYYVRAYGVYRQAIVIKLS